MYLITIIMAELVWREIIFKSLAYIHIIHSLFSYLVWYLLNPYYLLKLSTSYSQNSMWILISVI